MQLILTHADLEAALINDLRAKGMTAFEPGKASVEFSFKRGTKELVCTLDTEPKVEVHQVNESPACSPWGAGPKTSAETPSATGSASAALTPEVAPAVVAEEPAQVAEVEVVTTTEATPRPETGDDDNLFD